ncbi:hypothetical protein [Kitasatospora sp. NPDC087315]|uniref:hypothetical protein n=1 Tax=Kitasatospora sp. NPDC087315 TaxID=3364069 RepID=UPI00380E05F0
MNKDLRDLVKKLTKQGFEVGQTKSGHYAVRKNGARVATLPGSPSDHRAMANVLAVLKRAGFKP